MECPQAARSFNLNENEIQQLESLLDTNDRGRRLLFAIPRTAGDVLICTSLLKSISELYPELHIYFATEPAYFPIVEDNPYIYRVIPYKKLMDNLFLMEGIYQHPGWFEVALLPHIQTQQYMTYQHNQYNRYAFELFTEELKAKRNLIRMTK